MDRALSGPSGELPVHAAEGEVAEVAGEFLGTPVAVGVCGEEIQNAFSAAVGCRAPAVVTFAAGEIGDSTIASAGTQPSCRSFQNEVWSGLKQLMLQVSWSRPRWRPARVS